MADRFVTHTGKDANGDITRLGNPNEEWSPREKTDVLSDIENGIHQYYTDTAEPKRANIVVVAGMVGKYLFTDRDGPSDRHLLNLPDI